jgi:hypothetical protein
MYQPLPKKQVLENKPVISFYCRLHFSRKMKAKMKVYPRMLLKTKDRKCSVGEEARMCMKIRHLSVLSQNVDERKEDSCGRALPNSELQIPNLLP